MVFSALYGSLSGVNAQSNTVMDVSSNIANSTVVGHKMIESHFYSLVTGASTTTSSSGGVLSNVRHLIDKQGLITPTGNALDFAVNGQGMIAVNSRSDGKGTVLYTRSTSFRQDQRGNLVNSAGFTAMGWSLDNEGRLPGEGGNTNTISNALLESLTPLNFKSVSGTAIGTSTVKVGVTLNASQGYLKGAGEILQFPKASTSENANVSGNDLIIPSSLGSGRINIGDQFVVKATPPGVGVPFTYGGVTYTGDISVGPGLLGAGNTTARFSGANNGDKFSIKTSGNVDVTFTYSTAAQVNPAKGEFSTLETLKQAINSVNGLTARISNNRLFLGTIKGTEAITFTDIAGGFVAGLGFQNISQGVNRFSTVSGLRVLMNQPGLVANDSGTGGIDFYAARPSGTVKVHGISVANTVLPANAVDLAFAPQDTKRTIRVTHNAHGLVAGDYISIKGFTGANGATIPNGVYRVHNIPNANSFDLYSLTDITAAGPTTSTSFTWQKAPGRSYAAVPLVTPNITTVIAGNAVTIADAAHTLNAGDVIYLDNFNQGGGAGPGGATLPNGYYTVSAVAAGASFTVASTSATIAAGPAALAHNITYRKVGIGTPAAINTTSIITTNGLKTVRVYMPNHGYAANNIFTFSSTPNPPNNIINGLVFDDETTFTVLAVGNDAAAGRGDYFEFQAAAPATATSVVGAAGQATDGFVGLGSNEYTRLFNELGLSTTKFDFGPSYSALGGASGASLAEESVNLSKGTWVRPLSIIDSLGNPHDFRVAFAKLDDNVWAVEIYAVRKPDSTFDIVTSRPDGQIAAGTLNFNGDGTLAFVSSGLIDPINISWVNQALDSKILFNWGTSGAPAGTPGATTFGKGDGVNQVNSANYQRFLEGNGILPGLLNSITINKDGLVIAGFSNGSTKAIYKIPLVEFSNYNGLSPITGNAYTETNDSGSFNLRQAGEGGMGTFMPESLEKSNAELSTELTKLIVAQKCYQANAKVMNVAKELLETLDRSL